MIAVRIHGVVVDPASHGFAVILIDDVGKRWLPIFIGPFEAQAIASELEHFKPSRPLTHDLMKNLLESLGAKIINVCITELRDNTFFAKIAVEIKNSKKEIDARPSDGIALALRSRAPVLVSEDVMKKAAQNATNIPVESAESNKIKELQMKLHKAVEDENYEQASKIRDEIRKLKGASSQKLSKLKNLKMKLEEAMKKENIKEINKLQEEIKKLERDLDKKD